MRPGDAMDGAVQAAEGAVDMVTVSGVVLVMVMMVIVMVVMVMALEISEATSKL